MTIKFYGAEWCGDCRRAKDAFRRFQTDYEYHDVDKEEGAAAEAVEISGQKHIPVILYPDGSFQVEPSALDIKGKLMELGSLTA